ncbi:hypothetical protein BOX15_Mlig019434g1, partial [Macrostomum lignano]
RGRIDLTNLSDFSMASDLACNRDKAIATKLVHCYLYHRYQLNGNSGINPHRELDPMMSDLLRCLLTLTKDYEQRYRKPLTELCNTWMMDAEHPRQSFEQVLDTMLADGCNWGRVVTMFIFVGMFMDKCTSQGVPVSAGDVAGWTVDYLVTKVAPWIHSNGDWVGLIRFCGTGDATGAQQRAEADEQQSRMFRRVLTVGAAGLVMLGLTSLLVKRA